MQHYAPPKSAFDPLELAVMKSAFDAAWIEITTTNLIDLRKDDAQRKAVCLKLFSLGVKVRSVQKNFVTRCCRRLARISRNLSGALRSCLSLGGRGNPGGLAAHARLAESIQCGSFRADEATWRALYCDFVQSS